MLSHEKFRRDRRVDQIGIHRIDDSRVQSAADGQGQINAINQMALFGALRNIAQAKNDMRFFFRKKANLINSLQDLLGSFSSTLTGRIIGST